MDDSTIITARPTSSISPLQGTNFMEWGAVEIESWLNKLLFDPELVLKFTSNNIVGDTLPYLTEEHFKEMGVSLRDKVRLKTEINKLIAENGFIKQRDNELKLILTNINDIIQSNLDDMSRSLNEEFYKIKEEIISKSYKPLPTPDKHTNPSSPFNLTSPTKPSISSKSPNNSDVKLSRRPSDIKHNKSARNSSLLQSNVSSNIQSSNSPHSPTTLKPHTPSGLQSIPSSASSTTVNTMPSQLSHQTLQSALTSSAAPFSYQPVSEPLKQLRASTDDPCSKILQAAMKRHKLNDQDWRNYALVLCYGDKERVLDLNEKPVTIFKDLRERGEHPAIMLRQKSDYVSGTSQTPGGKL